jgi:hypothetical protein
MAPKNLYIDGVKFNLWTPQLEVEEFHPIIKEHSEQIFGSETRFLDITPRLRSEAGIGSEPDGIVVNPITAKLYVIEAELSKHEPYKHINDQLTRFINGLEHLATKNMVVDALFDEIEANRDLAYYFREKVKDNLHKWLSVLLSKPPSIVVVIEEKTPEVLEACKILTRSYDTRILEFQTFQREGAPNVHAHLFDSLTSEAKSTNTIIGGSKSSSKNTPASQARGEQYFNFYQELSGRLKEKVPTAIGRPNRNYYCQIPIGLSGVHFEWLFWGNPRAKFCVELHFEKGNKESNLAVIRELEKYKEEIEKATSEKVFIQENWGAKGARMYLEKKEGNMTEELKTWAVEKMALLYNFLLPKIEALK